LASSATNHSASQSALISASCGIASTEGRNFVVGRQNVVGCAKEEIFQEIGGGTFGIDEPVPEPDVK